MRFFTKNQETTSFKKRYSLSYRRHRLLFGEFAFSLLKSYNIEYIYIYNFKKKLKKFFFFKRSKYKRVWLFLHKNYPLTKKSKNARMGKGKGSVVRYCSRICRNHNLFEFTGFGIVELMSLKRVFKIVYIYIFFFLYWEGTGVVSFEHHLSPFFFPFFPHLSFRRSRNRVCVTRV